LLQQSLLGYCDVVAGRVLDGVHHLVGLANNFVRALGVVGVSGKAEAGADVQVEPLVFQEEHLAHGFQQTLGHDERGLFAGLRQQDHKLIAAVAKGKVNQAQMRLDKVSNLRQQLRSHQMSVSVIHILEVVKINKNDAELVAEARRAVNLGLQRLIKMSR